MGNLEIAKKSWMRLIPTRPRPFFLSKELKKLKIVFLAHQNVV